MENNFDVDLTEQNSLKLRSVAKNYIEFTKPDELKSIRNNYFLRSIKIYVIGDGTNSIFPRKFNGLVLKHSGKKIEVTNKTRETVEIKVDSGVNWENLIDFCIENQFYGLENLAGIPGSAGAAPIQNIGAYGVEISEFIDEVEFFSFPSNEIKKFSNKECAFSYRNSIFKKMRDFVISSIKLKLKLSFTPNLNHENLMKSKLLTANELVNKIRKIRSKKIPDPKCFPNVGSFYKNPIISNEKYIKIRSLNKIKKYQHGNNWKISAASLIDSLGFKGSCIANVGISNNHGLVLVNRGISSFKDIHEFDDKIRRIIKETYNISLETEPSYL